MRRIETSAHGLLLLALAAGGCEGAFFAAPAPGDEAAIRIHYQIAPGAPGGSAAAFDRADSLSVRLWRPGTIPVTPFDTTVAISRAGNARSVRLAVPLEGREERFVAALRLRAGRTPLFAATDTVTLKAGEASSLTPSLAPVLGAVVLEPLLQPIAALGDQVRLVAYGLFATGDTITHRVLPFVWETLDPDILSVTPEGQATALAEGSARLRVSIGGTSGDSITWEGSDSAAVALGAVEVRALEARIAVEPAEISLLLGLTTQLVVVVFDANGNRLERTPTFEISDGALLSISPDGILTGLAIGSATIRVTAGAASTTVQVTVLPLIG